MLRNVQGIFDFLKNVLLSFPGLTSVLLKKGTFWSISNEDKRRI
jgi:hypothetical protein